MRESGKLRRKGKVSRWGNAFLRLILIAELLSGVGCGSGRFPSPSPQGRLRLIFQSLPQGRMIPHRTARFRVVVKRPEGTVEVQETFDRPSQGTVDRTYTLGIGPVRVIVRALASDGEVLAGQSGEVEIQEDQTAVITLELQPRDRIFPHLTLTADPVTVKTGEEITLSWEAVDDDQLTRVEVDTNGDGARESVSPTGSVVLSFPDPLTVTFRGEVEDNDGLTGQATAQVEVLPRLGEVEIIIR